MEALAGIPSIAVGRDLLQTRVMVHGEGSTHRSPTADPEPGSLLGGYRIERMLGRGGMGSVFEANQLALERRVALKLISAELSFDEGFRERFRREARVSAAVEHPNLLPIYEAGELDGGRLYISMRYVDGHDLETRLRRLGPLGAGEVLAILGQIASALDAAHGAGLIHRDVKPANVLLEARQGGVHAYLADFGLAREAVRLGGHTETGSVLGTVDYMAPEQLAGERYGPGVDVYAFGGVVYRSLTGLVPYKRETPTATLLAHREAPVPRPSERVPGLAPALDRLVARAMAKDPRERAGSAGELMREATLELQSEGVRVEDAESPTLLDGAEGATTAHIESPPLIRSTLLYIAVYALIWAAAYLIGRNVL